jgi:F0F1-type ATP synthase assembly protein I
MLPLNPADDPAAKKAAANRTPFILAIGIVWELTYIIAIPVIVFGVAGAYLDKYLHTSPLFLVLGCLLALGSSVVGVLHVMRRMVGGDPQTVAEKKS